MVDQEQTNILAANQQAITAGQQQAAQVRAAELSQSALRQGQGIEALQQRQIK